ncbi:MAG: hypothetical protein HYU36_11135 [Planctomycetes bacterium]|nr:hypothetical protein [Planctomycetota bacterium]
MTEREVLSNLDLEVLKAAAKKNVRLTFDIIHGRAAFIDLRSRLIHLPQPPKRVTRKRRSSALLYYQNAIQHEIAHALYTTPSIDIGTLMRTKPGIGNILQAIEDGRINRLMTARFHGARLTKRRFERELWHGVELTKTRYVFWRAFGVLSALAEGYTLRRAVSIYKADTLPLIRLLPAKILHKLPKLRSTSEALVLARAIAAIWNLHEAPSRSPSRKRPVGSTQQ